MESLQATKTRLKAVKNVGQITKAMEVVAATKMRRAQEVALNSRPYAYEALHFLKRLVGHSALKSQLSQVRKISKTLVVIMASDRGLAGSFNGQVFKVADQFFTTDSLKQSPEHEYLTMAVGKKSVGYIGRKKYKLLHSFDNSLDVTSLEGIAPITKILVDGFLNKDWDRVVTISTHFRTALKQEPLLRQILPLSFEKIKETIEEIVPEYGRYSEQKGELTEESPVLKKNISKAEEIDYIFEPSPKVILESLTPHLVDMQIYHLFLEAKASEHSARRIAMKTASDNAVDLGDALTLEYNKSRQVGITRELAEITTTIMTLE